MAGVLGRLLDCSTSAQDDQIGERDLLSTSPFSVVHQLLAQPAEAVDTILSSTTANRRLSQQSHKVRRLLREGVAATRPRQSGGSWLSPTGGLD